MINSSIGRGKPTELNMIFKEKRPPKGTDGVLFAVIKVDTININSTEEPKSIPLTWAANNAISVNASVCPFLLKIAPKGTVNEATSGATPISSNVSKLNGIVAFDEFEENANNVTATYFLMNIKGFILVKIMSMSG